MYKREKELQRERDVGFLQVLCHHYQEERLLKIMKKKRSSYTPFKPKIKVGSLIHSCIH